MAASKTAAKKAGNSRSAKADHLKPHQFKPGQSGNPNGRPKKVVNVEQKALDHAEDALKKLIELVNSDDARVALQAAQTILDRAVGKATQPTADVTGSHEDKLRELEQRFNNAQQLPPPSNPSHEDHDTIQ